MSHEVNVILYADGTDARLGDAVDFDGEPATVIELLQITDEIAAAGFREQAVGFKTSRLGGVWQSPCDRGWDGIKLLERGI
jgi:hypothetical protein